MVGGIFLSERDALISPAQAMFNPFGSIFLHSGGGGNTESCAPSSSAPCSDDQPSDDQPSSLSFLSHEPSSPGCGLNFLCSMDTVKSPSYGEMFSASPERIERLATSTSPVSSSPALPASLSFNLPANHQVSQGGAALKDHAQEVSSRSMVILLPSDSEQSLDTLSQVTIPTDGSQLQPAPLLPSELQPISSPAPIVKSHEITLPTGSYMPTEPQVCKSPQVSMESEAPTQPQASTEPPACTEPELSEGAQEVMNTSTASDQLLFAGGGTRMEIASSSGKVPATPIVLTGPKPLVRMKAQPPRPIALTPSIAKKKPIASLGHLSGGGLTARAKLPQTSLSSSRARTVSALMTIGGSSQSATSALQIRPMASNELGLVPSKRQVASSSMVAGPKAARLATPSKLIPRDGSTLLGSRTMKFQQQGTLIQEQPTRGLLLSQGSSPCLRLDMSSQATRAAPQSVYQAGPGLSRAARSTRPSPEEVAKYAHEQVPALNKMKQELEAMSVSFARMANDALLSAWDPDFE